VLVDVAKETRRSLRAHRLRFTLTSLGIVWGIAMLTFLSAVVEGFDSNFAHQIAKVGPRIVFLFPGVVTKRRIGQRGARAVELKVEDVARVAAFRTVERAATNTWLGPRMVRAGRRTKLVWMWGATEDTAAIRNFPVATGRAISQRDVAAEATVLFLGATAAARLFGRTSALGRRVHVDGVPFRVIGVAAPKGDQLVHVGPADDEVGMVPVTTAQRWFTRDDVVGDLIYAPRTREESWGTVRDVRALLGLHHHFDHADDAAMSSFNIEEAMQIVTGLMLGLRVFLATASLITLMVGAVGVMNIMLVVVTERTREIGLRKAVGASNGAIFAQFLAETVTVTVAAGLLGALAGWLAVHALAAAVGAGSMMNAPPVLRPGAVALVLATLIGVAIASGILPAVRASRIDPAVSLRGA
jgi:putative ABC transport system permease protein